MQYLLDVNSFPIATDDLNYMNQERGKAYSFTYF